MSLLMSCMTKAARRRSMQHMRPTPMPTLVAKIRRLPHVRDPRLPVTRLLEALAVRHPLVARFGFRTT